MRGKTRYREKPEIDREQLCRQDRRRQRWIHSLRRVPLLLEAGETLGEAVREDDRIVLPIRSVPEGQAMQAEERDRRAFVRAWLEVPTPTSSTGDRT